MSKAARKLQRKSVGPKVSIPKEALKEIKQLPALLEASLAANKELSDENERIKSAVGDILEEHVNRIAALEKKVLNLELNSGDAANPGMVDIEGDGDEKPIHSPST